VTVSYGVDMDRTLDANAARYGETLAAVFDDYIAQTDTAETVAFLDRLLPRPGRAYELGIGTGRVALPLAALGHDVAGDEVSPAMVTALRAKPGGAGLDVRLADFVDGPPQPAGYDLVYCVDVTINVLGTRERQREFFRRSAAMLRPGGRIVVESLLPSRSRRETTDLSQVGTSDKDVINVVSFEHDPVRQTLSGRSTWALPDGRRYDVPFLSRYCTVSELSFMAELVGLTRCETYGDWSGAPLPAAPPSAVFVFST
jgi:SAM-dependent methyltransferase